MRYIELNPVRAEMVTRPGEYRWSSYGANVLGKEDKLLTPHGEYLALGSTAAGRQEAYRNLFVNEEDDSVWNLIRAATQQGVIAGDSRFSEMIEKRLGRKVVPQPRGRPAQGKNSQTKP
ncbi:MAG: hypothetical protein Q8K47_05515 [Nitrosomonas sp.]|nr:hypothetical protein [Nitrosomonas sp.]